MLSERRSRLYRLLTWLSPGFPVGGYAYSHGLEFAIDSGRVADLNSLLNWFDGVLRFGAAAGDAVLLRAAWQAVDREDQAALLDAFDYGAAIPGTRELALESKAQGSAFFTAVSAAWPELGLERYLAGIDRPPKDLCYAVAVGLAAAAAGIPLSDALTAYLHGFAGNAVSAAVRLTPLGQTTGLKALAALEPLIDAQVAETLETDDLVPANAAMMVDWMSIQHETQYARLFRS